MSSSTQSGGDQYIAPVLFALFFHVGAIALLNTAEKSATDEWDDETEVVLEAPPPEPEPPKPEPPKPEPKPEPVLEKPAIVKKVDPKPQPQTETKRTPPPVVADPVDDETASGDPDLPAPGGVFKMDDIVPGGAAMGGVGTGKSSGKGGSGKGVEKGGDGGEGKGTKKPVSIASIKKRAKPLNNKDIVDRRFNDVSGQVVVKLIVDAKGKVTKATVIKRLKPEVDKFALSQARKLRFEPAIDQNGNPVTSVVNWTFTFREPT